ncbi:SH3 domain-containing protein [Listeria welshimeri]|uniref:SH3 domain-containing protein n=1 Tax=Listeria welshimeri TaxID=1643 RepID=UPI0016244006|nr:SH3 domain-containing protein [Listeria welshimeri]MBC2271090.1 SH3 domain-containing protein [Listeria welshimeri]MBC2332411.1 SH3 domain-containing protein [Listeria welshimeri]MBS9349280.1 SH3 domain-containing protein [Listeria welshimeri]
MKKVLSVLCIFAIVMGMFTPFAIKASAATNTNRTFDELYAEAKKHLGKPYTWGARGPNTFDCSGYTQYVYKAVTGIKIADTSAAQYAAADKVKNGDQKPGDLVYFTEPNHVGIYIGNGQMINAQDNGVTIDNLNVSYWKQHFVGYGRIFNFSEKKGTKTAYAVSDLNLRSSNNWDSSVAGEIPQGAKVSIDLDSDKNGWCMITYNNIKGYMLNTNIYFSDTPVIKTYYAKDNLNLRTKATWDSEVAQKVQKGEKVTVNLKTSVNGWYQVTYGGKTGYMILNNNYLVENPLDMQTYYAVGTLNLRSEAKWDSSINLVVPEGQAVKVEMNTNSGSWYKVTYQNQTGYIPLVDEYLSSTPVLKTYYAKDNLNLRSETKWDSDVIQKVQKGEKVTVNLKTSVNGWYQLTYNGKKGYMILNDNYLVEKALNMKTYYAVSNLNLRSGAKWDSDISQVVPEGKAVKVEMDTNEGSWFKVTYDNKTGYMPLSDLYLSETAVLKTYYAKDNLNLRSEAKWDSEISQIVEKGEKVTINSKTSINGWYEVTYGSKKGYMVLNENYLVDQPLNLKNYYAVNTLNLRSEAKWDSSTSQVVPEGAKVKVEMDTNNGNWFKVTYDNKTGYMPLNDLYLSDTVVLKTYYAKDNLNLRSEAKWDSKISLIVQKGEKVTVNLKTSVNGWYQVTYGGKTGYMLLNDNYLVDQPLNMKTYYAVNALNLRNEAKWDSDINQIVPAGAAVKVEMDTNNGVWYKVTYQNKTGYMPLTDDYLTLTAK